MAVAASPIDLAEVISRSGNDRVPSRFLQPAANRASGDTLAQIPTIDLESLLRDEQESRLAITEKISKSCKEWGFFQVVNHGIPCFMMEAVRDQVQDFLDLPMEEKLKRPIKFGSYHPTGFGRLFDFGSNILDWVDTLIHYLSPPALKDPDYWPELPQGYRVTIEAYSLEVQKLVKSLLKIMSESLGFTAAYLEDMFGGDEAQVVFRVNHYPRCQQSDLVMGLSPHSDGSAVTVLLHDDNEGLQVKRDGKWWTVKPVPGALIINMGDMMQLASNGRFISAEHRAVVHKDVDRMSVVVFYAPTVDAIINPTPSPSFLTPIYKSVKYGDYLTLYMNREMNGKDRINSLLLEGNECLTQTCSK